MLTGSGTRVRYGQMHLGYILLEPSVVYQAYHDSARLEDVACDVDAEEHQSMTAVLHFTDRLWKWSLTWPPSVPTWRTRDHQRL